MTTLPMGRSSALVCPQISGPLRCPFLCDAGYVLNLDITSVFVLGALVMLVAALFRLGRRRRDR